MLAIRRTCRTLCFIATAMMAGFFANFEHFSIWAFIGIGAFIGVTATTGFETGRGEK